MKSKKWLYFVRNKDPSSYHSKGSMDQWILTLPPITGISGELQKEYEEYKAGLELLRSV